MFVDDVYGASQASTNQPTSRRESGREPGREPGRDVNAGATRLMSADSEHGTPMMVSPVMRSARALDNDTRSRSSVRSWLARCTGHPELKPGTKAYQAYLSYLTVGIVYGDIGTSPLYTFSSIFASGPPTQADVVGALSLMIWTLILVTAFKYLTLVVMADDHGEGGTFAIYALLSRGLRKKITDDRTYEKVNTGLAILALVGVSLVLADGVLTPAISVLGAVAGLQIAAPASTPAVVPVTCVILFLLFAVQYKGTERIAFIFSPILVLWFFALACIGIYNISRAPQVLVAFSPSYGFEYFITYGYNGWATLGAVFLTVTGSEAMFADMGHFNANAMRTSAFCLVLPSLLICYCGQAAAIVIDPTIVSNTFFLSMPQELLIPMLILATLAAIIASQAMISATFSIVCQAMRLQCFPRMTVKQTSKLQYGQVYVPEVNYFYMAMVIIVVVGYENATALGYAYGVAVSSVFLITTFFYSLVIVACFKRRWVWALVFFVFFGIIEGAFLSANLLKFTTGGWFTVALAFVFSLMLSLWRWGRLRMVKRQAQMAVPEEDLFLVNQTVQSSGNSGGFNPNESARMQVTPTSTTTIRAKVVTVPSSVVICFSSVSDKIPATFVHFLRRLPARPQYLVFCTVTAVNVPFVESDVLLAPIGDHDNVYRALVQYGYGESPPDACTLTLRILRMINRSATSIEDGKLATDTQMMVEPTFMLGHDTVCALPNASTIHNGLVSGFSAMLMCARPAATSLNIPPHMLLEIGVRVPI
jgi:KUP system potassium uptake protein